MPHEPKPVTEGGSAPQPSTSSDSHADPELPQAADQQQQQQEAKNESQPKVKVVDADEPKAAVVEASEEEGLSDAQVERLREEWGYNEVTAKQTPEWVQIAMRYLGLVPIILLVTAVLSAAIVDADGNRDWVSFGMLVFLVNLVVWSDYLGDRNAKNAMKAVEELSAPQCTTRRNGEWVTMKIRELVPGDIVSLRAGVVVPADGTIIGDGEPLSVDESMLTGESLAVTKRTGDDMLSGAMIKRGERAMRVTATGENSFFGKTLSLLGKASQQSAGHLKMVLNKAAKVITLTGFVFVAVIFFVKIFARGEDPLLAWKLAFVVWSAIVPSAMPVVTTTVLSVGAVMLSRHKAVVQRLSAIEEMAGLEILCSDKTGTLTKNELQLDKAEVVAEPGCSTEEILLFASLASVTHNPEAIDIAINAVANMEERAKYKIERYIPFNPVDKRTEATLTAPDGTRMLVSKGAPHIIRDMVAKDDTDLDRIDAIINSKAVRGLRTLGVARCTLPPAPAAAAAADTAPPEAAELTWELMGYISLFDPPREDTEETIREAVRLGVDVKMVTGDQLAIAIETAKRLGMGTNIVGSEVFESNHESGSGPFLGKSTFAGYVESVSGFAGVYPEHKFKVVETLLGTGKLVGMTGDGVNDAPALKLATVGVAVAGATDAAKSASDIVLLAPGLSTIIHALVLSRQIFRRVEAYIIYRIEASIMILLFFFFSIVVLEFDVPTWILILLSIINDFTLMSTSRDRVPASEKPEIWDMGRVVAVAFTLGGLYACAGLLLVYLAGNDTHSPPLAYDDWWEAWGLDSISEPQLVACLFLNLTIMLQLSFLSCRSKTWWFWFDGKTTKAPSLIVLIPQVGALVLATLLSVYWPAELALGGGATMAGCGWAHAGVVWLYSVVVVLILDVIKVITYQIWWAATDSETLFSSLWRDPHAAKKEAEREVRKQRRRLDSKRFTSKDYIQRKVEDWEEASRQGSFAPSEYSRLSLAMGPPSVMRSSSRLSTGAGAAGAGLRVTPGGPSVADARVHKLEARLSMLEEKMTELISQMKVLAAASMRD